jgi:hypothetical protein
VGLSWRAWAPPLDPPVEGALPEVYAAEIASLYWQADPWLCLALMWEAYAATLPTEAAVVSVSTGVQSVGYAAGRGAFDQAMARAQWFREQRGQLVSVPAGVAPAVPQAMRRRRAVNSINAGTTVKVVPGRS